MAILIKSDATLTEVKPADGKKFSLSELQGFVGGYIELVPTNDPTAVVWAHEEALCVAEPQYNKLASLVVCRPLYGDVLIASQQETE